LADQAEGANSNVDHTRLTLLIDTSGMLRVQYHGAAFDLEEFRGDLLSLVNQAR
jgi:protein SCO1